MTSYSLADILDCARSCRAQLAQHPDASHHARADFVLWLCEQAELGLPRMAPPLPVDDAQYYAYDRPVDESPFMGAVRQVRDEITAQLVDAAREHGVLTGIHIESDIVNDPNTLRYRLTPPGVPAPIPDEPDYADDDPGGLDYWLDMSAPDAPGFDPALYNHEGES